jgi:hypothetical protein
MSNHVKTFFSGIVLALGIMTGATNAIDIEYVNSVEGLWNKFGPEFIINGRTCDLWVWNEKDRLYNIYEMVDAQRTRIVKNPQHFALLFVVPNSAIKPNYINMYSRAFAMKFYSTSTAQQGLARFLGYYEKYFRYLPESGSLEEGCCGWSFERAAPPQDQKEDLDIWKVE